MNCDEIVKILIWIEIFFIEIVVGVASDLPIEISHAISKSKFHLIPIQSKRKKEEENESDMYRYCVCLIIFSEYI